MDIQEIERQHLKTYRGGTIYIRREKKNWEVSWKGYVKLNHTAKDLKEAYTKLIEMADHYIDKGYKQKQVSFWRG